MRKYKVYKHTFPNGKIYIGITSKKNVKRRWGNGGSGYKDQAYMRNAINKYGWENVKHEILYEGLTKGEAEQKEVELIKKTKSNIKGYGYNIQDGGGLRGNLSPNGRKVLSEKMIKNNPMRKKEVREKVGRKLKGRALTESHKQKMSTSAKNKKRVICVTTNEIFCSIKEAARRYQVDYSSIVNICKGNRVSTKGLSFAYLSDSNKFNIRENKVYKKIRCIETGEIFNSVLEATLLFRNKKSANISNALNGRSKTAFGYSWEYVK